MVTQKRKKLGRPLFEYRLMGYREEREGKREREGEGDRGINSESDQVSN
jgi:hypothetical protein